jgi:hypothetical protein
MKIDGSCHCGAISYEADIDPNGVMICHCTDCQVNSATAFRYGVLVKAADFRLLSGEPKRYLKTAESGSSRALAFCPECGTSLYGCDAIDPQVYSLRLGTARQRDALVPKLQIWRRSAVKWLSDFNMIALFDTQPHRDGGGELRK